MGSSIYEFVANKSLVKISNRGVNSVNPDETARHETPHLGMHCFAKVFMLICKDEWIKASHLLVHVA